MSDRPINGEPNPKGDKASKPLIKDPPPRPSRDDPDE